MLKNHSFFYLFFPDIYFLNNIVKFVNLLYLKNQIKCKIKEIFNYFDLINLKCTLNITRINCIMRQGEKKLYMSRILFVYETKKLKVLLEMCVLWIYMNYLFSRLFEYILFSKYEKEDLKYFMLFVFLKGIICYTGIHYKLWTVWTLLNLLNITTFYKN